MNKPILFIITIAVSVVGLPVFAQHTPLERECVKDDWAETRAFSPAVVTSGGRVAWLAGVTATKNEQGEDIGGDFDAQAHEVFRVINERLVKLGGDLQDVVTMTVYIKDTRYGDPFVDIRRQYFPECFPSSALITVVGFARPGILLEIKATAVLE
jgi:enamine deaminase RidA (YjgF/YER057c/UK114 family)